MSLSKQLLILISALFLMIFSLNFLVSINKIRGYLESESQVHAQDTATSLGLSLSPYMVKETDPIIETMMNAIFDMGYYQEIKLVNADNKPLVTLSQAKVFEEVPEWFIHMIPIKTTTAESEISSGWNISGVVYVTNNPGFAYLALYEQAKSSFYYSLGAFVFSILLLMMVLHFTLLPLKKIDQLALAIASGKYETIEKLPWTTEVRNVTASMNAMSRKIGDQVNKLNAKLELQGETLNKDDLTGLLKKGGFETDIKELFEQDTEAYILMIKIDGLAGLVKELGDEEIDQFLRYFAAILRNIAEKNENSNMVPYRFFGSEFVLLVKQINKQKLEQLAQLLSKNLAELGERYQKPDIVHIGVVAFNPLMTTAENLLAANEAYEQAQLIGANRYYIRSSQDKAKDISEWKSLVFDIVDRQDYSVSFMGQVENFQNEQPLMDEAFTRIVDKKGKVVATGTFISIAEKFSKIVDLDKAVTEKVINHIKKERLQSSIAINVSTRTIKSSDFRSWLVKTVQKNQSLSSQLIFSVSAYAIAKEVLVYKKFFEFIHQLNAKVMIKRFETQSMSPEVAKSLNPDFIRLARDIGNGISQDESKQAFVETMQELSKLLEISVLAENVATDEDYDYLKTMGITGASRKQ